MKNLYIYITLIGLIGLTACDPNEEFFDNYERVKDIKDQVGSDQSSLDQIFDETFTLSASDYEAIEKFVADNDTLAAQEIAERENFLTVTEAEKFLPSLVNGTYFGEIGQVLKVSYKLFTEVADYETTSMKSTYTLVKEDYDALGFSYPNFAYYHEPQEIHEGIATILTNRIEANHLGTKEGDYVEVTYDYYSDFETTPTTILFLKTADAWSSDFILEQIDPSILDTQYELTNADYELVGNDKYYNIDLRYDDVNAIVDEVLKNAETPTTEMVGVTYKYYNGSNSGTALEAFEYKNGAWAKAIAIIEDLSEGEELHYMAYDEFGEGPGKYDNFSSSVPPQDYLSTYLTSLYPYAQEGTEEVLRYKYYGSGSTKFVYGNYIMTEGTWLLADRDAIADTYFVFVEDRETLYESFIIAPQFTYTKVEGTPETVDFEYEITDADYDLVGNGRYGNFDEEEDVVIEKISKILNISAVNQFSDGAIVKVMYKYYDGSVSNKTMYLEASLAQ